MPSQPPHARAPFVAYVGAILGLPVCAAILAGGIVHGVVTLWYGEPLAPELAGIGTFSGLASIAIVVAIRAIRAARQKGKGRPLSRIFATGMTLALIAGAVAGSVFILRIDIEHFAGLASNDRSSCYRFLGADPTEEALDRCTPVATRCRHQKSSYLSRVALKSNQLVPTDWPAELPTGNSRSNAALLCLHEHRTEF